MKIKNIFSNLFSYKSSRVMRAIIMQGTTASWSSTDYHTLAKEGYEMNPYVFACIQQKAKALASLEWVVYQKGKNGEEDKEIPNHPLKKLIDRPNPYQSKYSFFERVSSFLDLDGNSFIEKISPISGPNAGKPQEVYALRPDYVEIYYSNDTEKPIKFYRYTNGTTIDIDPNEILHLKKFNPLDDKDGYGRGLSPLKAGARSGDNNNAARAWNTSLLQNGARPDGALVTESTLGDTEYDRAKEQFEEKYVGQENAGRPLLLEGGLKWQQFSINPKDLDWSEGMKQSSREICIALGVPSILIGDMDSATYSNYKEAKKILYESTTIPDACFIRDGINNWLAPLYGEDIYIDFDRDKIDALQEDRDKVWARVKDAYFLKENEKRQALGYGYEEGLDIYRVPMNLIDIPAGKIRQQTEEGKSLNFKSSLKGGVEEKAISRQKIRKLYQMMNLGAIQYEKPIESGFNKFFKNQEKEMINNLDKVIGNTKSLERKDENFIKNLIQQLLNWKVQEELATELLQKAISNVVDGAIATVKLAYNFVIDDKQVKNRFSRFAKQYAAKRVIMINETTRAQLRKTLSEGIAKNETNKELSARIKSTMDYASNTRAKTIAQTESHNSFQRGIYEAYASSGVQKKRWLSSMDERVRDTHQEINGETISMNGYFSNGLLHPGDPNGPARETINCRCVLIVEE